MLTSGLEGRSACSFAIFLSPDVVFHAHEVSANFAFAIKVSTLHSIFHIYFTGEYIKDRLTRAESRNIQILQKKEEKRNREASPYLNSHKSSMQHVCPGMVSSRRTRDIVLREGKSHIEIRITVTHSRCDWQRRRTGGVQQPRLLWPQSTWTINAESTPRMCNQCQSSREGQYCPSSLRMMVSARAWMRRRKTPSAKHDLNWTVLRVMPGSFDLSFSSHSFFRGFFPPSLPRAGGPTFWADT